MIQQARLFLCALQLMTRLPVPTLKGFQPDWIARSAPWYPVVGWGVGLVCAGAWLIASRWWPGLPAAIMAIGAGVLLTGGLHEDGLADTADGLGGGSDPVRRLEIMKDSRTGVYGLLAAGGALTLKAALLAGLTPHRGALVLVLTHGAARAFAAVTMAALPYAGDPEAAKLKAANEPVRPAEAAVAVFLGLLPFVCWSSPIQAVLAVAMAAVAACALALSARRLIGGYTGDILGAVEQTAEVALLLGLAVKGIGA
jgi:adenosylcobinamide-GDP ribazoletransferase